MSDNPVAAGKGSFDLMDKDKVFSIIDAEPGSVFLDLACGTGRYSIAISEIIGKGGVVHAVDLWREGIEFLDKEKKRLGLENIRPMVADIREKLPFEDASIDGCLTATILHDLPESDRERVVCEIKRILKPGGTFSVIEFKKIDKGPGPPIEIRLGEKEVEDLVTSNGFKKISLNHAGEFNYIVKFKKV